MSLRESILRGALGLDFTLADEVADSLVAYVRLLEKWNQSIRLVAPCTSEELVERHIVDCLALHRHLPLGGRFVDVGSGGGLPSVVIAAMRPAAHVTAIEPVAKKHSFLMAARRELGLKNFEPRRGRDEELFPDGADFVVATSRATFALPEWLDRGRRLVTSPGRVLAMEGRDQHALPNGAERHPYPLGDRLRSIVVLSV